MRVTPASISSSAAGVQSAPPQKKQSNENRLGAQRNSRTGVRNVCRYGQRWRVVIGHEGRSIYVGTFDSLDEADAAARAKRNALLTANFADRVSA
jgi:hypothetical protein